MELKRFGSVLETHLEVTTGEGPPHHLKLIDIADALDIRQPSKRPTAHKPSGIRILPPFAPSVMRQSSTPRPGRESKHSLNRQFLFYPQASPFEKGRTFQILLIAAVLGSIISAPTIIEHSDRLTAGGTTSCAARVRWC